MSKSNTDAEKSDGSKEDVKQYCGIVMPISTIDGCNEAHWSDVKDIISDAIEEAGFTPNIVSDADESGVIHRRIIRNLYDYEIVVCDVSGKNPNVMFELGMRLAFDKPTIIIKDSETGYSFDTSSVEYLEYPRDLRFSSIVEFKERLSFKIKATYESSKNDPNYTTFLKHFGDFKTVKIETTEVGSTEYILEELRSMRSFLSRSRVEPYRNNLPHKYSQNKSRSICMGGYGKEAIKHLSDIAAAHPSISKFSVRQITPSHSHLHFEVMNDDQDSHEDVRRALTSELRKLDREVTKPKPITKKPKKGEQGE